MNKEIYLALSDRLAKKVPELKFIDWDNGQLNIAAERPAIDYPACLIDINYSNCRDITDREQIVTANIILKLVFRPFGETCNIAHPESRARAMQHFDVLDSVHDAIQGCTLRNIVSAISRRSAVKSVRSDKLIVYTVQYDTTFETVFD